MEDGEIEKWRKNIVIEMLIENWGFIEQNIRSETNKQNFTI